MYTIVVAYYHIHAPSHLHPWRLVRMDHRSAAIHHTSSRDDTLKISTKGIHKKTTAIQG